MYLNEFVTLLLTTLCLVEFTCSTSSHFPVYHQPEYLREWAAKVSDPIEADLIAIETGFVNRGLIKPFHDIYLFENVNMPHRSKRHTQIHTDRLKGHEKILWAEQQVSKLRTKRDNLDVLNFDKRAENSAYRSVKYDDPEWNNQWYLVNIFSDFIESAFFFYFSLLFLER